MDGRWQQTLRTQVVKYDHWQGHKSNTPPSNERTKLQLLLQMNSPKSGKAIIGQSYFHVLIEGSNMVDNA